jgi:hypothetical protein
MFDGGKALAEQLKNLPPRHFIVKSGSDHWTEGIVPNVEAKKTSYRDLVDRARKIYARPRADIEREIIERRNNKGSKPNEDLHNWD